MSNFITQWILELVDGITAPADAIQTAAEGAAEAVGSIQTAAEGVSSSADDLSGSLSGVSAAADSASGGMDSIAGAASSAESGASGVADAINEVTDAADDAALAEKGMTEATEELGDAANSTKTFMSGLKSALLPLVALSAIIGLGKSSLEAFDIQAKADAQLMTSLESSAYAAGRSFEELTTQASALQGVTLFGDEVTMGAQALMLSFSKVSGEIYDRSIPAAQDMATALKTDLRSATTMLGKSLNDPIIGLTTLRRSGIMFNEEQEKLIKGFVEMGNVAAAQGVILDEVQKKYGGSAQAAAEAGMGSQQQIANAFADLTERLGELLYKLLELIQPALTALIYAFNALFDFIKENENAFKAITIGATAGAVAFGIMKISTFLLAGGFGTLATTAVSACATISTAIVSIPIIGWIAAAIAAIIVLGVYFYETSATFRGILWGVWDAIKAVFGGIGGFVKEVLEGIWHLVKGVFNPANWFNDDFDITDGLKKIGNAAQKYGETVGKAFKEGQAAGEADFEKSQKEKEAKKNGAGKLVATDFGVKTDPGKANTKTEKASGLNLSGSGSGGSAKSITMNLTMHNHFSGLKNLDEACDYVVRRINDRLADSLAAL